MAAFKSESSGQCYLKQLILFQAPFMFLVHDLVFLGTAAHSGVWWEVGGTTTHSLPQYI